MANQAQRKHAIEQLGSVRKKAIDALPRNDRKYMTDKEKVRALKQGHFTVGDNSDRCWYNNIQFNDDFKLKSDYEARAKENQKKIDTIDEHFNAAKDAVILLEKPDLLEIINHFRTNTSKVK